MLDLVDVDGPLGQKGGAGPSASGRNVDHVCLRIEPFDAETVIAYLQTLGLPHSTKAVIQFGAEGDGPSVMTVDPDGNPLELKGSLP